MSGKIRTIALKLLKANKFFFFHTWKVTVIPENGKNRSLAVISDERFRL